MNHKQNQEQVSIFDIFKIGVGPSSSHTLGPWQAARRFAQAIQLQMTDIDHIEIHLFGSLSKTGIGHATDVAVQLGLKGFDPKTIDTSKITFYLQRIQTQQQLLIHRKPISFSPKKDIFFHQNALAEHPNALIFKAFGQNEILLERTYYSIGGGFIEEAQETATSSNNSKRIVLPFPNEKGADLLRYATQTQLPISNIVYQNELAFRNATEISANIQAIFNTMLNCVFKGCQTDGILPGGLNVKRRAKALHKSLLGVDTSHFSDAKKWLLAIGKTKHSFNRINKWVSCFALAVNEENAALGRVVTSPTNGAAGVIPAVLLYLCCFCEDYKGMGDIQRFLLTSGVIGSIFKKGATISAAVGGCQAEIGVSSAMAAGGLTEVLGGTPQQVLMAAEIAMEHHLGLTCDPVGGLVQIPCIERNAMGAMKAITASNLALSSNPDDAKVNLDVVIKTMWDTAQDMNHKYKETSEGGLAFNLPVLMPNC